MNNLDLVYDSASETTSQIAKTTLNNFAEAQGHQGSEVARIAGRVEANRRQSDIQPLKDDLVNILLREYEWSSSISNTCP